MPNWVSNTIKPLNEKDWGKLKELLVNAVGEVDFSIITPIHNDLQITSGSYSYTTRINTYYDKLCNNQTLVIDPKLKPFYNDKITQSDFVIQVMNSFTKVDLTSFKNIYGIHYDIHTKDFIDAVSNIIKGYFNLHRYGYTDWYEACYALWGTKWNASCSYVDDACCKIEFNTAWCTPQPILEKISKVVPIQISFADEDLGSNYGLYEVKDGNFEDILNSQGSIGSAIALQGGCREYIEEYFSSDNYSDSEIQEYFNDSRENLIFNALSDYDHVMSLL